MHLTRSARPSSRVRPLLAFVGCMVPAIAYAHVKWFSHFTYADRPRAYGEILSPTFLALAALSAITIAASVLVDGWLRVKAAKVEAWLDAHRPSSMVVLRVGVGATMLMAWQAGTLLAPELPAVHEAFGWAQFAVVLLLLVPQTVPIAGALLFVLWLYAAYAFSLFHLLDYTFYPGIAFALVTSRLQNAKVRGLGLPALYFTLGFSLVWVALEKVVYPDWALYVLSQHPSLAMGFPLDFFLVGCAFVELSLGHLLVLGVLGRTLALTITIVFLITSSVFGGKIEVMGHTPVHAALVVFILEGAGAGYRPPFLLASAPWKRAVLAGGSFVLLLAGLLVAYREGAMHKYDLAVHQGLGPGDVARPIDGSKATEPPHGAGHVHDGGAEHVH